MEHTPLPEDVIYVPSVEELEVVPEAKTFSERVFGGLPIQIGYCNGNNHKLNAVNIIEIPNQHCGNGYDPFIGMAAGCNG